MQLHSYRDLHVWRASLTLVEDVYTISMHFPKTELFGLTQQIRKAVVSVPSNIAEGQARQTTKEFLRFLCIARASLAELDTQLILASRLQYAGISEIDIVLQSVGRIGRMIRGLERTLHQRNARPTPSH